MTSELHRGRLAKLFGILRCAVLAAAMIPASLAAHAQAYTLPPAEKVPTFLGIDLPLRPGERLAPTATPGCAVIVLAPTSEQYGRLAAAWREKEWMGACRFGLAHGEWHESEPEIGRRSSRMMLYGVDLHPRLLNSTGIYDGCAGRDACTGLPQLGSSKGYDDKEEFQEEHVFAAAAFNDLNMSMFRLIGGAGGETDSLESFAYLAPNNSFIEKHWFAADGSDMVTSYRAEDVSEYCGAALPAQLKSFSKEINKACGKKNMGKFVMARREGPRSLPNQDRQVKWMKSCPKWEYLDENDCPSLLEDALGKDAALLESALSNDAAFRLSIAQQLFDRFAALERAVDARQSSRANAERGGQ